MHAIPAVVAGLAAEFLVVSRGRAERRRRIAVGLVASNAFSALAGYLLIPVGGLAIQAVFDILFYHAFGLGSFHPFSWLLNSLGVALINAAVERPFVNIAVGEKIPFGSFYLANAVSALVALHSLHANPPRY